MERTTKYKDNIAMTGEITVKINGVIVLYKHNLITDLGKRAIAKAIAGKGMETPKYLWISDNITAPAASDDASDFATLGVDAFCGVTIDNIRYQPTYTEMTAMLGKPDGNFTWKKLGIVSRNNLLLAEVAVNFAGKTSSDCAQVEWRWTL